MKIYWNANSDPYTEVANIIEEKYPYHRDFVVKLLLTDCIGDKIVMTELLYDNGIDWDHPDLTWLNDWWEGEPEVELLGCIPISDFEFPDDERWKL